MSRIRLALLTACIASSITLRADQPVFNEMPRWDGGAGVQLVHEFRQEDDLLLKEDKVGDGLTESVHILHLEGVYTWDKSIRMTVKIPYVIDAEREVPGDSGETITQHDEGLGDVTVALPLKKYFNLSRRSGSWTLNPQVRIPTSDDDDYEIYDNEWGIGLGAGYETETHYFIFGIGAGIWTYFNEEPVEASFHTDIGKNFEFNFCTGSLKWENDLFFEDDGSDTYTFKAGPALYLRLSDAWHMRFSYHHDFIDRQGTSDHGSGDQYTGGIATVW